MHIIKTNVSENNKSLAFDILNRLRNGSRVFGQPAEGLKKTLMNLEEPDEDSYDSVAFNTYDFDYLEEKANLEAGIEGENTLAQYLEKIIRLDDKLADLIVFASLGDPEALESRGYIPDTDFLCVLGNNILIIDAKNIKTSPFHPIFIAEDNCLYVDKKHSDDKPLKPILELTPSVGWWHGLLAEQYPFRVNIKGCTCIVNKTGAKIIKNETWENSEVQPIHISELRDYIIKWAENKTAETDLELLSIIARQQIYEEKSDMDLGYMRSVFGV